jgi:hypothetical protein
MLCDTTEFFDSIRFTSELTDQSPRSLEEMEQARTTEKTNCGCDHESHASRSSFTFPPVWCGQTTDRLFLVTRPHEARINTVMLCDNVRSIIVDCMLTSASVSHKVTITRTSKGALISPCAQLNRWSSAPVLKLRTRMMCLRDRS